MWLYYMLSVCICTAGTDMAYIVLDKSKMSRINRSIEEYGGLYSCKYIELENDVPPWVTSLLYWHYKEYPQSR